MKFTATLISLVFTAALCASGALAAEQSSFDLKSPDKRIEVRIRTAHGIHYDVVLEGRKSVALIEAIYRASRSASATVSL